MVRERGDRRVVAPQNVVRGPEYKGRWPAGVVAALPDASPEASGGGLRTLAAAERPPGASKAGGGSDGVDGPLAAVAGPLVPVRGGCPHLVVKGFHAAIWAASRSGGISGAR